MHKIIDIHNMFCFTDTGLRIHVSEIKGHPSPGKVLNDQYEIIGGDESNCEV